MQGMGVNILILTFGEKEPSPIRQMAARGGLLEPVVNKKAGREDLLSGRNDRGRTDDLRNVTAAL